MIYPSIDYADNGANRIDISDIEAKAQSLQTITPFIIGEYVDTYLGLIDDLRETAIYKFGKKICGISSLYCYGSDDQDISTVELVNNYGSTFVGSYRDVTVVNTTNIAEHNELLQSNNDHIPAVIFSPLESEILPEFILDEYSGMIAELYPFVAIPLVGMPVIIEWLPLSGT